MLELWLEFERRKQKCYIFLSQGSERLVDPTEPHDGPGITALRAAILGKKIHYLREGIVIPPISLA